jgi:two-component system, OmpR family, sensor histidine kinase KdpD
VGRVPRQAAPRAESRSLKRAPGRLGAIRGYLGATSVLALCTIASFAGAHAAAFVTVLPVGVLAITARFGIAPAVFTAVAGVLVWDFVFVPPPLTLSMPGFKDGLTLVVMIAVATVAGVLAQQLRRQVQQASRQAEVEGIRNALLSSLSHDLRTPLTALVGAGTALLEDRLDARERREFSRMVADEAARLNHLVGNLLELTRLESGSLATKTAPQAIDEIIGAALVRLERRLTGRRVTTDVPEDVPLVPFDPVLIDQVLLNLLENILRYTPEASPIDIRVRSLAHEIVVEVADRGPGVPAGDEERVFEKLYRSPLVKGDGGVGLGLTICRAIVTAHGGDIGLENRPGGGVVVSFTLPIQSRSLRLEAAPAIPEISSP